MNNTQQNTSSVATSKEAVADKKEFAVHFNQMSDEVKTQFYRDCEEGISAEQSRENTLNFVRRLWEKYFTRLPSKPNYRN